MNTELDPRLQQEFAENAATHEAAVERVAARLTQRQEDIAEQAAKANKKFDAERAELIDKVKKDFKKPESDKPRIVGWNPTESTGKHEGVMDFGEEEHEDSPAPFTPSAPPRAPRHRRASEPDEDDYSEQSWLKE